MYRNNVVRYYVPVVAVWCNGGRFWLPYPLRVLSTVPTKNKSLDGSTTTDKQQQTNKQQNNKNSKKEKHRLNWWVSLVARNRKQSPSLSLSLSLSFLTLLVSVKEMGQLSSLLCLVRESSHTIRFSTSQIVASQTKKSKTQQR